MTEDAPTAGQRAANKKGLAQCVQTIAEPKNTRAKASRAARVSERIGEVLGVARQRVAEWIIPNAETGNASTPKDCRIKLSKEQERIGEVLGVARTTVELWLASRTNDRAVNASTPKDCRIKLSTLPTLPPMPKDAPTLAQRTPLASLAGGGMAVLRFSWDDMDRAGCRAAQMGFSLK